MKQTWQLRGIARVSRPCLAIGLALGATMAQAQNADTPAPAEAAPASEEIVVTAQFREQRLQDTPIAITAVSGAMMEARSQTDLSQVANQAPSVTLKPQGQAFGPSLGASIRGVGQFDFNPAVEPGVGLYVDDVYYATLTGSILDLLDLDRVEILRGPQGTLAGRNSIGGSVKLYSKKPVGDDSGYLSVAYGSRRRIDLRGSADFNLAPNLDMRISGVSKKQKGYVDRLDFGCVYPAGGGARLPASAPINAGAEINPAGGVPRIVASGDGSCRLAREGEINYRAVRGQLRFHPSSTLDINLIGDYSDDDRTTSGSVLLVKYYPDGSLASPRYPLPAIPPYATATPATRDINPFSVPIPYDTRFVCGKYCNYSNFINPADGAVPAGQADGRVRFRGGGVSGQIEWKPLDQLQFVSITAYREYTSEFANDNDLSPLAHSLGYGPLTFNFFSQELRLNGSFGDRKQIEYTVGGYYSDQDSLYSSFQDQRSSALRVATADPVKAHSKAVFGHLAWSPFERLTLNGGIRYTDEYKSYTYVRKSPEGGTAQASLAPLDGLVGTFKGDHVDYRLNVQYRWADELMTYVEYSTGFKGGGVNPRPFFVQQALSFGPETLKSLEAGAKADLFDRHVRLNAAAFFSKYKDIQLSLSNCTAQAGSNPVTGASFGVPCGLPVNAGDADIKGVEVETTIRPVAGMTIDGSVSYLDFDYKKFGTFTSTNPITNVTTTTTVGGPTAINGPQWGDYAPYTPKWKWSVGAQYELGLGGAGSLTPRIDATYQSEVFTNAANRESNRIPGYTIANARVTWRNARKTLEAAFEVTNLFDKYYFLTLYDQTIGGQGYASGQPGTPRQWAITLKKKF